MLPKEKIGLKLKPNLYRDGCTINGSITVYGGFSKKTGVRGSRF